MAARKTVRKGPPKHEFEVGDFVAFSSVGFLGELGGVVEKATREFLTIFIGKGQPKRTIRPSQARMVNKGFLGKGGRVDP